jgi:predicted transcriptional regulator
MTSTEKLVKKQFELYPSQIDKLQCIARMTCRSQSAVLRAVIDAYDPEAESENDQQKWLDLVSIAVKEAAKEAKKTRKKLDKAIDDLVARKLRS